MISICGTWGITKRRPIAGMLLAIGIYILALLSSCGTTSRLEQPAPWKTQLAIAQQAAADVAADAALIDVLASPRSIYISEGDSTLNMSFSFARTSGEIIDVTFDDTNITGTLKVDPHAGRRTPPPSPEQRERFTRALNTVQVSPADALKQTLAEGRTLYQKQDNIDPIIGLHMGQEVQSHLGVPAAWSVLYLAPPKELRIWVNAQSGEVLGRTDHSFYP